MSSVIRVSTAAVSSHRVRQALDYVAVKGVKVSNHSYGGFGASNIEYRAHETLNELGHLSICSAGNNGCDLDSTSGSSACLSETGDTLGPFTPASYDLPNIISVGGTTTTGELAWFSNYGRTSVDVFAPGSDIITIYGRLMYGIENGCAGKTQLASVKGTSFSAPIVAGMAAVVWSYKPELSAGKVKELIMDTGTHVQSLSGKARSSRIASLAAMMGSNSTTSLSEGAFGLREVWITGLLLPLVIEIFG